MPTEDFRDALLQVVWDKGWIADKWIVAREYHENGEPHFHAYIKLDKKINLKDPRAFDLAYEDAVYHPNIQGTRSDKKVINYVKKDGDWISNFWKPPVWEEIFKPEVTVPQALEMLVARAPRDMAINGDKIEANVKRLKKVHVDYVPRYPADSFKIPDAIKDWLDSDFHLTNRARALILIGGTRLGKTEWARSLGNHIYMQGAFNLDKWKDDADYNVLDDLKWKYIPNAKQLLCCKGESELTDKYRAKKTVMVNKPCIVLWNPDSDIEGFDPEEEYWRVNAVTLRVTEPFYEQDPDEE